MVPIPKEPNKSDARFFRPISLFPIVSKVLERHLHQLLMDQLLVSRNVLSYIQFGFRKDRATSSLCSSLHTIGIFHLKSTIKWLVFFFDFAKVFESVPHQALLNKLHQLHDHPTSSVSVAIQLSVRPFPVSGSKWNLYILATCYLWSTPGIYLGTTLVLALCK